MFMDAGSRVEYGLTDGFMQEDIDCHPVNQYGKAKWEFYQKAAPLCTDLGLHYVHLRFFSVYGTGIIPGLLFPHWSGSFRRETRFL